MRIEIHSSSFRLTDELRAFVERRIHFAFNWNHLRLQKITLRLDDINGPKHGIDKSCSIQIPMLYTNPIVIKEVQSDLYVAIDRAIERAAQTLSRKISRNRDKLKKCLKPRFFENPNWAAS
jgi:putative sigma-54 modulation protein